MQDDLRADLLYQVLSDRQQLPDGLEDPELNALAELGSELDRLGPHIAMIEHADNAFNPAFAHSLQARLMAEHPAAASVRANPEETATGSVVAPVVRNMRRITRRVVILAVIVLSLISIAIAGIINSSQPVPVASTTPKVTATAQRPRIFAAEGRKATPRDPARPSHSAPLNGSAPAATPSAGAPKSSSNSHQPAGPATAATPSNRAMQSQLSHGEAEGQPVYRLPDALPALPTTAPVYSLRDQPLSAAAVAAIVASFHDLRPTAGSGQYRAPGGDALRIARHTGEVEYSHPYGGAIGTRKPAITPANATKLARAWLASHALLPKDASAQEPSVQYLPGRVIVKFAPSTRYPLSADQAVVDLTVELNAGGQVVHAHRVWPMLHAAGTARLLSPRAVVAPGAPAATAGSAQGTPAAPQASTTVPAPSVVQIDSISLVYVPVGSGQTVKLQPFYRLQGRTVGGPKTGTTVTRLVPARVAKAVATAAP
jgi:hypothetical protein